LIHADGESFALNTTGSASGDGVVRAYIESGMTAEDFAEIDYQHSARFGHQKNRM
jgi:hypothetical protein